MQARKIGLRPMRSAIVAQNMGALKRVDIVGEVNGQALDVSGDHFWRRRKGM